MTDGSKYTNSNVMASFQGRSGADILMWVGVGLAALTILLGVVSKDMLVPGLAIFCCILWWLIVIMAFRRELRAVRLLNSGSVEFVKKFNKETYPTTTITHLTGSTRKKVSPEGRASISFYVKFILDVPGEGPLEKRIQLRQPDEPAFHDLTSQLEKMNPNLDISGYREWVKKTKKEVEAFVHKYKS